MGRYSTVVLKAFWTKPSEGRAEGAAQPAFQDQEIPQSCILGPVMAVDNLHDQVAIQVPHPLHMEDLVWINVWTQHNRRNGVALARKKKKGITWGDYATWDGRNEGSQPQGQTPEASSHGTGRSGCDPHRSWLDPDAHGNSSSGQQAHPDHPQASALTSSSQNDAWSATQFNVGMANWNSLLPQDQQMQSQEQQHLERVSSTSYAEMDFELVD